jgi:hypothetical protein
VKADRVKRMLWWCHGILRLSSRIVPRNQRQDWLREWRGEVWHWAHFLYESGRLNERTTQELLRHCWGSFSDALWHRFNREKVVSFVHRSPLRPEFCIGMLLLASLLLIAGNSISWFRSARTYSHRDISSRVLTVSLNADSHWVKPERLRDAANQWPGKIPVIAKAESYAWRPDVVLGPAGREDVLSARVTSGFFALVRENPVLGHVFEASKSSCTDCVVLSHAIWKDQFGGRADVVGRSLVLDGRQMKVIGVLAPGFRLAGLDIGLFTPFGDETSWRLLGFEEPGALIRLADGVKSSVAQKQIQKYVNNAAALPPHVVLDVLSTTDLQLRKWERYASLFGIGLLAFGFLSWSSLVGLRATGPRRHVSESLRWWGFLAIKSALLVLIVCAASADLVQLLVSQIGASAKEYADGALIWLSCVASTIALVWSIRDQFGRCRSCLRRFTRQMVLGTSAGVLSGPTGIEVICEGGHGSLHLPVIFHSCLDSRYWTELDDTWRALIGGESIASTS